MDKQVSVQGEPALLKGVVQLCCQIRRGYVTPFREWHNESQAGHTSTEMDDDPSGEGIIPTQELDRVPDPDMVVIREDELPGTGNAFVLGEAMILAPCIPGPRGCAWDM